MIRTLSIQLLLFLTPFALYAAFLWATRSGVLEPKSWPMSRVGWLTASALILVIGSFIAFAQFGGSPPGSTYVPAHIENGRFVPGRTK